MSSVLLKRARVIIVTSISCSVLLAFLFGLICLSGGYGVVSWVLAWLLVHLGPLYPFIVGLFSPGVEMPLTHLLCGIVFSGLVAAGVAAYLIHPAVWTRMVSIIAIILWFFCGFVSIIMGIT